MSNLSRRKLITTGIAATAGISGLAVAGRIAQRYGLIPPDHGGIYGPGKVLTYASQRLLTRNTFAREFPRGQISTQAGRKRPLTRRGGFQAPAERRLRGLAACRRRHGSPPRIVVAYPTQELSLQQPNYATDL